MNDIEHFHIKSELRKLRELRSHDIGCGFVFFATTCFLFILFIILPHMAETRTRLQAIEERLGIETRESPRWPGNLKEWKEDHLQRARLQATQDK